MRVHLSRRIHFNVARRLHNPSLDEATNRELYGEANNPNGFGHNLVLDATVVGQVDPVDGMVLNLVDLDRILKDEIHAALDHRHLNLDVSPFDEIPPTAENLIGWIHERVEAALPERAELAHLRLQVNRDFRVDLGDPRLVGVLP